MKLKDMMVNSSLAFRQEEGQKKCGQVSVSDKRQETSPTLGRERDERETKDKSQETSLILGREINLG